ncbi:MAG: VIT1/CCC1 transporter family protein [Candidatus ainarchaeum sp.]|nr:VIT1/CCC1 transporter family protein [Candidatus ainarchaeum sp.]
MQKNAKSDDGEHHTIGLGRIFRNVILGGQDGVVNVLGIVLGVATATNSTYIVLLAGLAATFAESISMAAVAYTSTRAEIEHYESEVRRELKEIDEIPDRERKEIEDIYREKGFSGKLLKQVVDKICSNRKVWLGTMMRDELGLENPSEGMSAFWQAVLVGGSAVVGSLVPIATFFFLPVGASIPIALAASLAVLFVVGAYKSRMTSGKWLKGGLELMLIGGAAAVAGWLVGVLFQAPAA